MQKLEVLKTDQNFKLHLITKDYKFFINENESDETAAVKMFDHKDQLISNNNFAFEFYIEILAGETDEIIIFSSLESLAYQKKLTELYSNN